MNSPPPRSRPDPEATASLLLLARQGDRGAREILASRYLHILKRFAHGRLPRRARDLMDTDDLVLVSVVRALEHVESFEPRREGAFLAYLRRILVNQIRDEIRRVDRRPERTGLDESLPSPDRSPLEEAIGAQALARYEEALAALSEAQREAVVMRLELDFSYEEIAQALGHGTANAARMMVSRALLRMGESMGSRGDGHER